MLPTDQPTANIATPRAAFPAPERQRVGEQLTQIEAEIRLLVISAVLTLCGIGSTLAIVLLRSP